MTPEPEKTPLKFYTYPQQLQDKIMREFWYDYFEKYPEKGGNVEINALREQFSPMRKLTYAEFLRSRQP